MAPAPRLEADRPSLFGVPMGNSVMGDGEGYELRIAAFTACVYPSELNDERGWHWGLAHGGALVGSDADDVAAFRSAHAAAGVLQQQLLRLQVDLAEMVEA